MVDILGTAICLPCSYDPSYKVDVRLHEQLWGESLTTNDLAIEVMTLCSQLEALCEAEAGQEHSPHKEQKGGRKRTYSNTFETQASLVEDKMEQLLKNLPEPRPTLKEYLVQTGLEILYSRAAHYISGMQGHMPAPRKAAMDGYLTHLATINQVTDLCKQLHHDAQNLHNHKYIAHQVALLYQSLNQLGNVKALLSYRTNIETTFKSLKAALESDSDRDSPPHLPDEYKQWLLDLTSSLTEVMTSFNTSFNQPLLPAMGFLQQTH